MVEIFLNPDNETVGGEALESVADASASGGSRKTDSELIAVLTADKLLKVASRIDDAFYFKPGPVLNTLF